MESVKTEMRRRINKWKYLASVTKSIDGKNVILGKIAGMSQALAILEYKY